MTIKINKLSIEKDRTILDRNGATTKKLDGNLFVGISERSIEGLSEVKMSKVSESLQEELYKVLNKIEDELNGIGTDEASGEETINITLNINNMSGDANEIEKFSKRIADALKRTQGIR